MLDLGNLAGLGEIGVFEIVLPRRGIDALGAVGGLRFVGARPDNMSGNALSCE
jgi:hypothetical protein